MKKSLWIGLSFFLAGIWIFSFSLWFQNNVQIGAKSSNFDRFLEYFSFSHFVSKNTSALVHFPSPSCSPTPKKEIIVYLDFSCPHCKKFSQDTLLFYLKNPHLFSLSIYPFSHSQNNEDINNSLLLYCLSQKTSSEQILERFNLYTGDLKTWRDSQPDAEELKKCMNNPLSEQAIAQIYTSAQEKGVRGVPTFFFENQKFEGAFSKESFLTIVSSFQNDYNDSCR